MMMIFFIINNLSMCKLIKTNNVYNKKLIMYILSVFIKCIIN